MEFHPIANCFPLMEGKEFAEFVADIKARGVRDPILLFEGKILDGRNRYRAAVMAGTEERVLANALKYDGDDPYAEVVSANIHRRHLTVSQLGWCAAEMSNLKLGSNRFQRTVDVSRDTSTPSVHTTQKEVAKLFGISRPTVARAAYVKKRAPEMGADIRSGKITVAAAARRVGSAAPPAANSSSAGPSQPTSAPKPAPRQSDTDGRFDPYRDLFRWLLYDQGVDERILSSKIGGCQIPRLINALAQVLERPGQNGSYSSAGASSRTIG